MRKQVQIITVPSGVVEAEVEASFMHIEDLEDVLSEMRGYPPDVPIPYTVVKGAD